MRGLGGGSVDQMIVICILVFCFRWSRTRNVSGKKTRGIKTGKLRNESIKLEFQKKLNELKILMKEYKVRLWLGGCYHSGVWHCRHSFWKEKNIMVE